RCRVRTETSSPPLASRFRGARALPNSRAAVSPAAPLLAAVHYISPAAPSLAVATATAPSPLRLRFARQGLHQQCPAMKLDSTKVAVITGGSSGFGRALAYRLSASG